MAIASPERPTARMFSASGHLSASPAKIDLRADHGAAIAMSANRRIHSAPQRLQNNARAGALTFDNGGLSNVTNHWIR